MNNKLAELYLTLESIDMIERKRKKNTKRIFGCYLLKAGHHCYMLSIKMKIENKKSTNNQ